MRGLSTTTRRTGTSSARLGEPSASPQQCGPSLGTRPQACGAWPPVHAGRGAADVPPCRHRPGWLPGPSARSRTPGSTAAGRGALLRRASAPQRFAAVAIRMPKSAALTCQPRPATNATRERARAEPLGRDGLAGVTRVVYPVPVRPPERVRSLARPLVEHGGQCRGPRHTGVQGRHGRLRPASESRPHSPCPFDRDPGRDAAPAVPPCSGHEARQHGVLLTGRWSYAALVPRGLTGILRHGAPKARYNPGLLAGNIRAPFLVPGRPEGATRGRFSATTR